MGVLSLARGTYPSLGGIYLCQGGTLLGWRYIPLLRVPTLARGIPAFARGVPTLAGEVPTLARGYLPSSCQKDVKCQKVKHTDYGEGSQKTNSHNEVHTY